MFRKKKNRTKCLLSCVQVAGGMREVGRGRGWYDDTRKRKRETQVKGGGEKKESEKGGPPRGGSCAGGLS